MFTKDDMFFVPYDGQPDAWQCKITIGVGTISVRYGGHGIITDEERPYEVWYPTNDSPLPYQTADNIWDYIKNNSK